MTNPGGRGKIFCIGFHKTGTTSLGIAFEELGFRVCGVTHELVPFLQNEDFQEIKKYVDRYEVFKDNPWPLLFRQLDEFYPGSKFVLTLRDENKWIQSVCNHFGTTPSDMRMYIYGVPYPLGNEEIFLKRYRQHNQDVLEFFKSRPEDLLITDVTNGQGWEGICTFLNIPIPDQPFPHENKRSYSPIGKLRQYLWKRIRAKWRSFFQKNS